MPNLLLRVSTAYSSEAGSEKEYQGSCLKQLTKNNNVREALKSNGIPSTKTK